MFRQFKRLNLGNADDIEDKTQSDEVNTSYSVAEQDFVQIEQHLNQVDSGKSKDVSATKNKETCEGDELLCSTQIEIGASIVELCADEKIRLLWSQEQADLKKKLLLNDIEEWSLYHQVAQNESNICTNNPKSQALKYLGGVDISFIKGDNINACAALVVIELPSLKVVYEDLSMVKLTAPYIPGFLAFREASFLVEKFESLKTSNPTILPQVIMVDGNGILHPREFGLASHLGVLLDIPTLGVAKNLFQVHGLERNESHKEKITKLKNSGDTFPLVGESGTVLGVAYRSSNASTNPIYISQGHKVSLDTAVWIVKQCCKYRIPEPTRQADVRSREFLRNLEIEQDK